MDATTQRALAVLGRCVRKSQDSKARRAIDVLSGKLSGNRSAWTPLSVTAVITPAATAPTSREWRPALQPSAREFEVFVRAAVTAQAHGLKLPANVKFEWFNADEMSGTMEGCVYPDKGAIVVGLRRGLTDRTLFAAVLHELAHASDIARFGVAWWRACPKAERERRAYGFERSVMARVAASRHL